MIIIRSEGEGPSGMSIRNESGLMRGRENLNDRSSHMRMNLKHLIGPRKARQFKFLIRASHQVVARNLFSK